LRFQWSPHDTTIAVGAHFTAQVALYGCGGTVRLNDTISFRSSDAAVVGIDSVTGVAVGSKPGAAEITASAKHYGVTLPITVHVQ
jgi:hypothetical protein